VLREKFFKECFLFLITRCIEVIHPFLGRGRVVLEFELRTQDLYHLSLY
jgi:hypothetical protein